jgi:hypothetical protein
MRFRVPSELAAGVYRQGVGRFPPGAEFEIPDAASRRDSDGNLLPYRPHYLLEPLDEEAEACLHEAHKGTPRELDLRRLGAKPPVAKKTPRVGRKTSEKVPGFLGELGE